MLGLGSTASRAIKFQVNLSGACFVFVGAQIQEQWYRLGSYQARFAAADALQVQSHSTGCETIGCRFTYTA